MPIEASAGPQQLDRMLKKPGGDGNALLGGPLKLVAELSFPVRQSGEPL
jgi:hypothetical protein